MDMESDFEGELFETGAETESESEYFMQHRGGRGPSGSRGFSGRPHSFMPASFAKSAVGGARRGALSVGGRAGAFARSGDGSRDSRGRFARRFWRRPWTGRSGFASIGTASEFVSSMQSCLQQVVGAWVPQTGIMGPGTRRAVRIFQMKSGMPVTGLLDEGTVSAIQSACSSPVGPEGPPAQDAPPEPPPAAPAGPEAAAAAPGDESGGEMESELGQDTATEQEFQIDAPCELHFLSNGRALLSDPMVIQRLPTLPGLYVIYSQGKPWYVGSAEKSLRERFQRRFKVLRDFNLTGSVLAGREVAWVSVDKENTKNCAVGQRPEGSTEDFRALKQRPYAVLKVVEQNLIRWARTLNLGNERPEPVRFKGNGSLEIKRPGAATVRFDGSHPI
jgi:hypothetical protein